MRSRFGALEVALEGDPLGPGVLERLAEHQPNWSA